MLGFFYVGMSEWSKVYGCNPESREFESHSQLNKCLYGVTEAQLFYMQLEIVRFYLKVLNALVVKLVNATDLKSVGHCDLVGSNPT